MVKKLLPHDDGRADVAHCAGVKPGHHQLHRTWASAIALLGLPDASAIAAAPGALAELAGQAAGTLGGLAAAADDNRHRAIARYLAANRRIRTQGRIEPAVPPASGVINYRGAIAQKAPSRELSCHFPIILFQFGESSMVNFLILIPAFLQFASL